MYIIFKSAESDELFTKVNRLKGQIEEQRKENEQLALNLLCFISYINNKR